MKKGKILPIVLGVITAAAIVTAAAVVFMDPIMRSAAPALYLAGRAGNTYKEITSELKKGGNDTGFLNLISDHHKLTADGKVSGTDVNFTEQYDKTIPQSYITGKVKGVNVEAVVNNDNVDIALPDMMKYRVEIPSSDLGQKINSSPLKKFIPIEISSALAVSIPKKQNIDSGLIYNAVIPLAKSAKIDKKSTKEEKYTSYTVYVSGEEVKNVINTVLPMFFSADSEMSAQIMEMFSKSEFPETAAIKIGENEKRIVYLTTTMKISGNPFTLIADLSESVNMLDNVKLKAEYSADGEPVSIDIKSSGNHTRPQEAYSDNTQISITTPITGKIYIESNRKPKDSDNFSYSMKMQSDNLGDTVINSTGKAIANGTEYNVEKLNIGGKISGEGTVTIQKQTETIEIQEKEIRKIDSIKSILDLM